VKKISADKSEEEAYLSLTRSYSNQKTAGEMKKWYSYLTAETCIGSKKEATLNQLSENIGENSIKYCEKT
jgi:hypothetical protein